MWADSVSDQAQSPPDCQIPPRNYLNPGKIANTRFKWRNRMVSVSCSFKESQHQSVDSGKSTQVPAFILEDQLSKGMSCKIYCTEPRRISAISLAQRVSRELGDAAGAVGTLSSLVGYSIRLESNTSRNTRLAFVTNGIALRMLEGGSGQGGQGTAFDEITVSFFCSPPIAVN